ncbi:MAG: histidine decarboxylase, pyruvoyl type, partial [Prochloraceae cyanobacterium]|nr:histidine decarboxylase, pyruvoyl type [Prochloraceae cyanobacterium]
IADMDFVLEGIVSYDRAEKNDAYIGQINMVTASSFCGLNGAIWGYDLALADELANRKSQPLSVEKRHDGVEIPIRSVEPLLDATKRLFGTQSQRRFPLLPGAMVACLNKSITKRAKEKPKIIWCALALAIAEERSKDAHLFIEDVGEGQPPNNLIKNIYKSILLCGEDQNVLYKEIFVGCKELTIPPGGVGCALTCAPYVTLAQKAIPRHYQPADLLSLTISEWENALSLPPLSE